MLVDGIPLFAGQSIRQSSGWKVSEPLLRRLVQEVSLTSATSTIT
ncbi:hypothetical protein CURTO8I2_140193 [Curtobacterium sp. 8I-2]|nr:hypothetical protein CURTO8I2_140193 [Curtobacterium sp. 8I-2]